jgi:hypothetical protein
MKMVLGLIGLANFTEKICPCGWDDLIEEEFVPFLRSMVLYASITGSMDSGAVVRYAKASVNMDRQACQDWKRQGGEKASHFGAAFGVLVDSEISLSVTLT